MLAASQMMLWAAAAPGGPAAPATMIPTTQIAPGVHMPMLMMGGYNITGARTNHPSNYSIWLADGNVGIDGAWMYDTNANIAGAIKASGVARDDLFITSKIPCSQKTGKRYPNPMTKAAAAKYIADDLAQMGLEYIDLMLVHWPCITAAENAVVWEVLEEAVQKKQLKAIGVSNFKPSDLEALKKTQKVAPVVNQCRMSVGDVDKETIAYGKAHGITYEAYSALQGGGMDNPKVKAIAASHGVAAADVIMRWITQQGIVVVTGSMKQEYDLEDEAIFKFNLTAVEMATLDGI